MSVPDPGKVVVSYVGYSGPVSVVLTTAQAREHWARLAQPHRDTYSVRPAEMEDFEAADAVDSKGEAA